MKKIITVSYFIVAIIVTVYISGFFSYTLGFWDYRGFPFSWSSGANEGVVYPGSSGLSRNVNYFYLILDIFLLILFFGIIFIFAKKLLLRKFHKTI